MEIAACRFFFLPGVPYEMKRMLAEQVLPRIRDLRGDAGQCYLTRTLTTFGLPESQVGDKVALLEERFPELTLGLRAKFPVIQVKTLRQRHRPKACRSPVGRRCGLGGRPTGACPRLPGRR